MHDNRLWLLIARQLSGEASAGETEELQALLQESPDKQYLLDLLHSYFSSHNINAPDASIEERFKKIVAAEEKDLYASAANIKRIPFKKIWRAAAAVAAISCMAWLTYRLAKPAPENKPSKISEVVARPGARTKLVLPDGTQVWLNSGSKLNYQTSFNDKIREVELEGEAYFDVVSSISPRTKEKIPFIVHASSINIRVVGTAFAVKSYPQDQTVEATLLRGIIEVTRKDNPSAPKVILKPNEKLTFNKQLSPSLPVPSGKMPAPGRFPAAPDISVTSVSKAIPDSEKVEISWVYNRLVFNGDSFRELAEKMERWYNVKIFFKNEDLLRYRFKGAFTDETVWEALDALQLTAKFNYQIKDNEIDIDKK
jgi:ferric-dicitrate binding protein FerR (iron transport regulator)